MSLDDELFLAIDRGQADRVPNLINQGADVNATNVDGLTPLMLAARNAQPDIVRELLATGADPFTRTDDGFTAFEAAIEGGNEEVLLTLQKEQRLRRQPLLTPDVQSRPRLAAAADDEQRRH